MGIFYLAIRATRPKQWVKNLLVAAAPIAAGQFSTKISEIVLGVIGFTAASIFGYLINDWHDREFDQNHPKKKNRPFASQELKFKSLISLLLISATIVILTCLYLPNEFFLTISVYLVITISYSLSLKNQPVIEMVWLAAGFLVRAIAGSTIIQAAPTGWFVLSVGFGALFMVSTKRIAEYKNNHIHETRLVISQYNENFLNLVISSSGAITLMTYSLWVFQVYPHSLLAQFTILPFTLSMLLYSWHSTIDDGESPEDLIYKDKVLIISSLIIVASVIVVIYK